MYDYLELLIFDVHCAAKGRLVAKQRVESVLKHGMGIYGAICWYGINEQPIECEYFAKNGDFCNMLLCPVPGTLTNALPCSRGKHNVGQVMCNLKRHDGSLETTTPRTIAETQLSALGAMGLTVRASLEQEFSIYHKDTLAPFCNDGRWANMRVVIEQEEILLDFMEELRSVGVKADTLQAEGGKGQYEITLDVLEGIQVADAHAKFKNAALIFFEKRGLKASFMTRAQNQDLSNGCHFNHSLWSSEDGRNIFLDSDDPDKLSSIGRHWLAGLITHTPALTALCCPTVNCYRRLHRPWVPSKADWGKDRRLATYRLKAEPEHNVYLESRIPSSASNPYLVMAGMVAAGIDGIKRKLELDTVNCDQKLPGSLEEALVALEEDRYMVDAIGKPSVEMYCFLKRTHEIKKVEHCRDDEEMAKEQELYFNYV